MITINYGKHILILAFLIFPMLVSAQKDSLVFKNGKHLVGEIKSLNKNVMIMSTSFSKGDFKVKWDEVQNIYTERVFLIYLSDHNQYFGNMVSVSDSLVVIHSFYHSIVTARKNEIVFFNELQTSFKDQFSAYIDLGFNLTAANELRQFTSRIGVGYKAFRWSTNLSLNTLFSEQTESDPISRLDGNLVFRFILVNEWYLSATASILSNTEQNLDIRSNIALNVGNHIFRTNRVIWNLSLGVNRNLEEFSNETPDRQSWEGVLSSELDLFNIGDFSSISFIKLYPGLSSLGRWRTDINIDLRYNLPLQFYIKLGLSYNFDNEPAEDASKHDYVFNGGIGWKW